LNYFYITELLDTGFVSIALMYSALVISVYIKLKLRYWFTKLPDRVGRIVTVAGGICWYIVAGGIFWYIVAGGISVGVCVGWCVCVCRLGG